MKFAVLGDAAELARVNSAGSFKSVMEDERRYIK